MNLSEVKSLIDSIDDAKLIYTIRICHLAKITSIEHKKCNFTNWCYRWKKLWFVLKVNTHKKHIFFLIEIFEDVIATWNEYGNWIKKKYNMKTAYVECFNSNHTDKMT